MRCPGCDAVNHDNAQFCDVCGRDLAEAAPAGADTDAMQGDGTVGGVAAAEAEAFPPASAPQDSDRADTESAASDEDPFYEARLEEAAYHRRRRESIEAAGGSEAYEEQLRESLAAISRQRRVRSLIVSSVGLVASLAAAGATIAWGAGWARELAAMPRVSDAPGGASTGASANIGAAFTIAVAMLLAAAFVGTFSARLGRSAVWGALAAAMLGGVVGFVLLPYVGAQGDAALGGGMAFGVGAFVLAALVGGLVGAWYAGSVTLE